ncbi:MAG TPA: RNA polymerase sigma factor [Burkholderiales bacterium]|nr:RNA polymerase sigma factor [Burkholderiales bacterium]
MNTNTLTVAGPASDDLEIARRIAAGDTTAMTLLMRQCNRKLFRAARSILDDDAEAEDALQEAYVTAYVEMKTFRGASKLTTWLTRIVINEALGRLRKKKRQAEVLAFSPGRLDPAPQEDASMERSIEASPEDHASRAELRAVLERKIGELPIAFRTVFMMRELEEMTVEETAECLGIPEATVRTRLFRARALLRESLAREIDVATGDAFAFAGARCDRIVATVLDRLRAANP